MGLARADISSRAAVAAKRIRGASGYAAGYDAWNRAARVESSPAACRDDTLGLSKPNARSMRWSRVFAIAGEVRNGHAPTGIQTSFSSGYAGSGGRTPTTVCT